MQQRNLIETIMGAVVLAIAAGFMVFAYEGSDVKVEDGFPVRAKFDNVTGINVGSDVRIGGIKVGVVSDLGLDPATYQAVATLLIREGTQIPADSSAAIASSGLLGDKFLHIFPGAEEQMLGPDGQIRYTQSSVSLEELIGKFVFSGGGVDSAANGTGELPEVAAPGEAASPSPATGAPPDDALPSGETSGE